MWSAITGENVTNPRPALPTTQWSLLHDHRNPGDTVAPGTILKIITSSYRTNCKLQAALFSELFFVCAA